MTWGKIAPLFAPAEIVLLFGGGPSLLSICPEPLADAFKAHPVIAVNEAAFAIPEMKPSAVVSIDQQFMAHRVDLLQGLACPAYLCPPEHAAKSLQDKIPRAIFLHESQVFSWDCQWLHRRGGSSGYGAVNAAILMGAKRIFLLGYDYKRTNGRKNWHANYSWPQNENFAAWARAFDPLVKPFAERGIEVINANPDSLVTAFPRMTFAEALTHKWRDQPQRAA